MSEENASGVSKEEVVESQESVELDSDNVSYDSYKKAVDQHKRSKRRALELQQQQEQLLEELNNYRKKDKEVEQRKLEEKGEYEKIMQALRAENKSLLERIEGEKKERVARLKKDAFLRELPGPLYNDQYLNLAKIDNIAVDPETGDIDVLTVKEAVDSFVKEHPALIRLKKAEEEQAKPREKASSPAAKPVNLTHLDKNAKQLSALEQYRQLRLNEEK